MKRIYLLLTTIILGAYSLNAQNTTGGSYQGFVDAGYAVGIGDYKFGGVEVSTSHGYQINPHFYIGGGAGFHFMSEYRTPGMDIPLDSRKSLVDVPVFANVRANLAKGSYVPFIDMKGGLFINNNGGKYISLSAGCSIAVSEKQAIDISVGYQTKGLEFNTFSHFISPYSMDYATRRSTKTTESLAIKVGFEF